MRLLLPLITWILFSYSFFPISSSSSSHPCLGDQSSALLQLKQSFSIDNDATADPSGYPKVRSWNPDTDCCSWDGVTCDGDTGRVIGLNLSSSFLYGPIDSESSLFHLHDLQVLNLADNYFEDSPIPSAFGRLTSLTHLNLSYSIFSGQIPLQISQLAKLVSLDLSRNYGLKLENPNLRTLTQNLSNLRELRLDNVNMSAEVNKHWCRTLSIALPHLRVLSLYRCSLPGPMDDSLLNFRFLSELSLGTNNFSSIVPDFLGNLTSLTFLDLLNCGLYGEFPKNILQLPNLQSLKITINPMSSNLPEFSQNSVLQNLDLSGTNLSGRLPNSIENLKFLTKLGLRNCSLGLIPPFLTNLTQLVELDLSFNNFHGAISSSLFFLPSLQLTKLGLCNCSLGLIPPFLTNLTQLVELDLSFNNFHGAISSSLFFLPSLQYLYLSGNQLTRIEDFHGANSSSFSSLQEVFLFGNQLKGTIPRFVFHLKSLKLLDLSSNDFNGSVDFNLLQNLKNLSFLDLSYNNFSLSNNSDGNFTSPQLLNFYASSCNFHKFPIFLKSQNNLKYLDLSNNRIHGKIPKWIWKPNMSSLDLSNNSISGLELPLPDLPKYKYTNINLRYNKIQEEIPVTMPSDDNSNHEVVSNILGNLTSYLSNANIFSISNNKLTGKIPLSFCNTSLIEILDLSNNLLSGQIPECPSNYARSLSILNLGGNKFHGTIPQFCANGSNLSLLSLNNNQLEGRMSRSLANCRLLEVLDLGNNQINDTFPFWLENLPRLQVLVLRSNQFHGAIRGPRTDHPFPVIYVIDLSFNNFSGNLPLEYLRNWKAMRTVHKDHFMSERYSGHYYQVEIINKGLEMQFEKALNIFTTIDLSYNGFQWEITKVIGDLTSLNVLNLSRNFLTGPIPSSLGQLVELESLDLSWNQLSGEIPLQLIDLTFLSVLNLSQNHLEGPIPRGKQFETFENTSYEGNLGLCGFPLSNICGIPDSTNVSASKPLQSNQDSTSSLDWKFMVMGYGCGIISGIIIGGQVPSWRIDGFFKITPRKRGLEN